MKLLELTSSKTYATRANAVKAVEKVYGPLDGGNEQWFFIYTTPEGRYFPVFVGERAVTAGIHHQFSVIN